MPIITLITNVQVKDSKTLNLELAKVRVDSTLFVLSSETLGQPLAFVSVNVVHNDSLSVAGSFEPAFSLKVESFNNINPEANIKHAGAYTTFLADKLSIPNDRGLIVFVDLAKTNLGFKGTTVAVLVEAMAKNAKPQ